MKNNLKNLQSVVAMTVMAVGLAILMAFSGWADEEIYDSTPQVMPPGDQLFGKSYKEWSAEWWKWHFRLPAEDHPVRSKTGKNCDVGQSGEVWFLTGVFTVDLPDPRPGEPYEITRKLCSVPTNTAIFFPIVNVECSTIEEEPFYGKNPGHLRLCAKSFIDGPNAVAEDLSVTIDGNPLENVEDYRFLSPVFNFEFENPEDNILGVDCGEVDCSNPQSVSDGYWIMLLPLSEGDHTINFAGSLKDPETGELLFGLDVTYELTVE